MVRRTWREAPLGPVRLALALAVIAIVPVAWSLQQQPPGELANTRFTTPPIDWQPIGLLPALVLAVLAVVPAALAGGWIGARVWARYRSGGAFLAMVFGWASAVVILPVAAFLLGIPLRTAVVCFMGCSALIDSREPLHGGLAAVMPFLTVLQIGGYLLIPIGVYALGRHLRRPLLSILGAVLAHVVLHGIGVVLTATNTLVPYALLLVGVLVWSAWMLRHERLVNPQLAAPGAP